MTRASPPVISPLFAIAPRPQPMRVDFDLLGGAGPGPMEAIPSAEPGSTVLEITVQAYAEGHARGRAEGYTSARAELLQAAAELRSVAAAITTLRSAALAEAEEDLVRLALAIATQVIRKEADGGADLARRLAAVGISRLGECARLTVRLHPEDAQHLAAGASGTLGDGVSLLPDPEVTRGGAVVECEHGRFDARLETQLCEIRQQLEAAGGPAQ